MKVIGLSGKIGCGKTTLADLLKKKFPGAIRMSFGDLLKQEVADLYAFPLAWCYDQEKKAHAVVECPDDAPQTPKPFMLVRELLQWYGTDYVRRNDPGHWVRKMDEQLKMVDGYSARLAIIDDVRFPDEAELVLRWGGEIFRIEPYDGWTPGPHAGHASETAMDDFSPMTICHPAFGKLDVTADAIASVIQMPQKTNC